MTTPAHSYLEGNFGPVHEEVTAVDLAVTGTIPAELDGRFLRNGPNPIDRAGPGTYHWFTGDGMVHGLRLRDGKAEWYRNRWVRSPEVAAALGEPAPPSPYGGRRPESSAPTPTSCRSAGTTFAIVEAGSPPVELTDELETVGPSNFSGTLEHPFSAHPKRRSAHRRDARRRVLLGLGQQDPVHEHRRRTVACRSRWTSRRPVARWCTTWRSPRSTRCCSTCR